MGAGGAAHWKQLRARVSQRALDKAVREGRVMRRGRGLYTLASMTAVSLARQLGGVVSHLSAAEAQNLGVLVPCTEVDITVSKSATRVDPPPGVRLHYGSISGADLAAGMTNALTTVLDCARTCDFPQALAVIDAAVRAEKVDLAAVADVAKTARGPGSARLRKVVNACDPRAASAMESLLRGLLIAAGITCFQPQFEVFSGGSRIATCDLGDAASRVLLEADSFSWHGSASALARDARRYDELVALGYVILRFTWEHLLPDASWVVETVRRVLVLRAA